MFVFIYDGSQWEKELLKFADRHADEASSDGDGSDDDDEKQRRIQERFRKRQAAKEEAERQAQEQREAEERKTLDKARELALTLASHLPVNTATKDQFSKAQPIAHSHYEEHTAMAMQAGGGVWRQQDGIEDICSPAQPAMYLITRTFDNITPVSSNGCLSFALSNSSTTRLVAISPSSASDLASTATNYEVLSLVQNLPDTCFGDVPIELILPGFSFHLLHYKVCCYTTTEAHIEAKFWSDSLEPIKRTTLAVTCTHSASSRSTLTNVRVFYRIAVPSTFFNPDDKLFKQPLLSFAQPELKVASNSLSFFLASHATAALPFMFDKAPDLVLKSIPDNRRSLARCTLRDLAILFRNGFTDQQAIVPSDYPLSPRRVLDHNYTAQCVVNFMRDMKGVCRHRANLFGLLLQSQSIQVKVLKSPMHAFLAVFLPKHGWVRLEAGGGGVILPMERPTPSISSRSGGSSGSGSSSRSTAASSLGDQLKAFATENLVQLPRKETKDEDADAEMEKEKEDSSSTTTTIDSLLADYLNSWQGGAVGPLPADMLAVLRSYPKHFQGSMAWAVSVVQTRTGQDRSTQ